MKILLARNRGYNNMQAIVSTLLPLTETISVLLKILCGLKYITNNPILYRNSSLCPIVLDSNLIIIHCFSRFHMLRKESYSNETNVLL